MTCSRTGSNLALLTALALVTAGCFSPGTPSDTNPFLEPAPGSTTDDPGSGSQTDGATGQGPGTGTGTTGAVDDTGTGNDSDSSAGTTAGQENTIYEIQDGTIASGEAVDVRGVVVTAVAADGVFVQEPFGGMFGGVFVSTGAMAPGVSRGDEVDVIGTVAESDGQTIIEASAGSVTGTGMTGQELTPELLTVAALAAGPEPWEGVLVRIEGTPLLVSAIATFGFTVTDGADAATVGNALFNVTDAPMTFPNFGISAGFAAAQGPLDQSGATYRVQPRDAADLAGYTPPVVAETLDFPSPGDASVVMFGTLPWNAGDYYEGVRNTGVPSISSLDVHVEIVSNGLSACGFQTADVIVNGVTVGDFTITQGTAVIDQTYMIPMPIAGPNYTVRYQTVATVASGCGAAGYSDSSSTVTFNP
ncbi:MAG: hypothetical protein AB1Z98_07600 [Nannocystaceae bacterium]